MSKAGFQESGVKYNDGVVSERFADVYRYRIVLLKEVFNESKLR